MFSSAGVALGDSWISPEDFVVCLSRALLIERENHIHIFFIGLVQFSWGPLLRDVSRLDISGLEKANRSGARRERYLWIKIFVGVSLILSLSR